MVAFRFLRHFICSLKVIGSGLENIGLIITGFNHGGKFVALSLQNSDKIVNSALVLIPEWSWRGGAWREEATSCCPFQFPLWLAETERLSPEGGRGCGSGLSPQSALFENVGCGEAGC